MGAVGPGPLGAKWPHQDRSLLRLLRGGPPFPSLPVCLVIKLSFLSVADAFIRRN